MITYDIYISIEWRDNSIAFHMFEHMYVEFEIQHEQWRSTHLLIKLQFESWV